MTRPADRAAPPDPIGILDSPTGPRATITTYTPDQARQRIEDAFNTGWPHLANGTFLRALAEAAAQALTGSPDA
jgi:hypothetical protein